MNPGAPHQFLAAHQKRLLSLEPELSCASDFTAQIAASATQPTGSRTTLDTKHPTNRGVRPPELSPKTFVVHPISCRDILHGLQEIPRAGRTELVNHEGRTRTQTRHETTRHGLRASRPHPPSLCSSPEDHTPQNVPGTRTQDALTRRTAESIISQGLKSSQLESSMGCILNSSKRDRRPILLRLVSTVHATRLHIEYKRTKFRRFTHRIRVSKTEDPFGYNFKYWIRIPTNSSHQQLHCL